MHDLSTLRFAFAHDWLVTLRGSELVLDRIIQQFGPAPLHTLVSNHHKLSRAIDSCPQRVSVLRLIPGSAGGLRKALFPLMPLAVSMMRVQPCDVLISSSSCVMKSLRAPRGAVHLCYCHTPVRYVWSQPELYRGTWFGLGLKLVRKPFQWWDRRTASRVDSFIAPSRCVAKRIMQSFGREAAVIHPPVRTDLFTPDSSVQREDFWLAAGALERVKRLDLAIAAANARGNRLVIAGAGSLEPSLRKQAGPTVEFVGQQPPERLVDLARRAKLFVNPSMEDFGIAAVEAMACGCPVVAYAAGGSLDTVTAQSGVLFDEQTVESLLGGIDELNARTISQADCRANAERFRPERFDAELRRHVETVIHARNMK